MQGIVESHGGSVEKFIGDAVMAVFGVPAVHEDDALRACRAAVEMRAAFAELAVEGRIGVSSGEVVTGTDERLATGDALNVAARLQQAAQPGQVLVSEATLALVVDAVDAEPVEPLALKGKSEPVSAFRLVEARAAPERRHETAFVGRERELALLGEARERALAEQRCELVTIVGDPGLGKSRLAAEALASFDTRVVSGPCLPYGTGITYWPVVEVVKQLDALPSDPAAAAAIRSLLGETDAGTSAEEIAWAFRKLLEEQSPLVALFDDNYWRSAPWVDTSARRRSRSCSRGSMSRRHEAGNTSPSACTEAGRWRCSAASTRRGRSLPSCVRSWLIALREEGSRLRRAAGLSTSSSWRAIPPPPLSSEKKGASSTKSSGKRAFCRARP